MLCSSFQTTNLLFLRHWNGSCFFIEGLRFKCLSFVTGNLSTFRETSMLHNQHGIAHPSTGTCVAVPNSTKFIGNALRTMFFRSLENFHLLIRRVSSYRICYGHCYKICICFSARKRWTLVLNKSSISWVHLLLKILYNYFLRQILRIWKITHHQKWPLSKVFILFNLNIFRNMHLLAWGW